MSDLGYDFFLLDEDLVRRPRSPLHMKPLYAERLVDSGSNHWRLDHSAGLGGRPITREVALARVDAPDVLDMPSDASPQRMERRWVADDVRIAWLDDAVRMTLEAIEGRQSEWGEITMSEPGSWDYDQAIGSISWMRNAYITIEAMLNERDLIIRRERMRAEKEYRD